MLIYKYESNSNINAGGCGGAFGTSGSSDIRTIWISCIDFWNLRAAQENTGPINGCF